MTDSPEFNKSVKKGGAAVSPNIFPTGKQYATIQKYHSASNSYVVLLQGAKGKPTQGAGGTFKGVPRMTQEPGDKSVLPNDATVVIDFGLGVPLIVGVVPKNATKQVTEAVPNVAPDMGGLGQTGEDSTYSGGYYRSPQDPVNMYSGDWCRASADGNFIAALRGKLNRIFGSNRAQIIVSGLHNLVRTVCENYEYFSSFGDLTIYNQNGRCNLKFVGAADQLNESGGQEQNWTFHLDIGDEGKLFNMRVTSADGRAENAQFQITPDGQIRMFGKTGWIQETAGSLKQTVGGDLIRRVSGGDRKKVSRAAAHTYDSDLSQDIAENWFTNAGNNETHTVGGNQTNIISKQRIETITGGPALEAKPTNVAYEVNVINGSYEIHIGDPTKLANKAAVAGFKVYAHTGAIVLGENPALPSPGQVSVSLNTLGPDSIGLGCKLPPHNNPLTDTTNPPADWAMMFLKWQAWAQLLVSLLDAHVHPTAWGPSLPAQVPPGTNAGFNAQLAGLIAPVKSIRVRIGL
jgi:hypothetical protein